MQFLDLTLPTIAENLALDEALLEEATKRDHVHDLLRIWESAETAVVVGRSTKVDAEVDKRACQDDQVPILRRCSGGTSVVAGPGCLMYALVVRSEGKGNLRTVDAIHEYVMNRMQEGLSKLFDVAFRGSCDLTVGDKKFSGNALRCKRNHFLYHGTVLYEFPLDQISKYLQANPPRQPDYRDGREHDAFVSNFPATKAELRRVIRNAWHASEPVQAWPEQATANLVRSRYSQVEWNYKI